MLAAIAIAEALGATIAAAYAMVRWSHASRESARLVGVVQRLDLEVQHRVADVISLSQQLTDLDRQRQRRPASVRDPLTGRFTSASILNAI